jgi:peptidylprolyl isomerase
MRTGRTIALAAAAAIAVSGCGSSQKANQGGGGAEPVPGVTITPESASDINVKPVIQKPQGQPPQSIQVRDLLSGNGKVAEQGDKVSVQYVGVSWSTGQEFDSSWKRGKKPFAFTLGGGQVIPGWDQGLIGMKQGGRRQLVIPPDQAYGPKGQPPLIGPNETLVFVVDLQKVTKSKSG